MAEEILHMYNVTNSVNVRANSVILGLNRFMRGGIRIGGIFHGVVEVYNKEWSFAYCKNGTGIFSCQSKQNPMYIYRESISLERTGLTRMQVEAVVQELSQEWPGVSYDLLLRQAKEEVLSASRNAMQFMFGSPASSSAPRLDSLTPHIPGNTSVSSPLLGSPTKLPFKSSPSLSQDSFRRDGSVKSTSDCDDDGDSEQPPPSDTLL